MHALHLPPRDLWRTAALAALLALLFTALLLATAGRLGSGDTPRLSAPQTQLSVSQLSSSVAAPARPSTSTWLKPLATPAPLVEATRAD